MTPAASAAAEHPDEPAARARSTTSRTARGSTFTRRSVALFVALRRRRARRPVLRAAAARRPGGHLAPDRGGRPVVARRWPASSRVGMFGGYVRCSRACSCARTRGSTGARATRSRMAGLAATRLFAAGGAGGHRAHGVGAAALGHGRRGRSPTGRSPSSCCSTSSTCSPLDRLRLRPALRRSSRARARSRSPSCPRSLALVVTIARALASPSCPPTSSAGCAASRDAPGPRRRASPSGSPTSPPPRRPGMRDALAPHRASATRRCSGAVAVLGLPHRRAVGVLPRVRRPAAARRDRHGLLRRHARQPAAAAGRHRRRRRRA